MKTKGKKKKKSIATFLLEAQEKYFKGGKRKCKKFNRDEAYER
jgi:hypothetical protein